jgi:hypothetical protein
MEARHYIGIILIGIGTLLIPIGWMFYPIVTIIGWLAFILGLIIFMTQKVIEKMEDKEFGEGGKSGTAVPTDIHDYSGWGSGGRSEGWSSSQSSGNDGGGGD